MVHRQQKSAALPQRVSAHLFLAGVARSLTSCVKTMSAESITATELMQQLAAAGSPTRAEREKSYLKSHLTFLGVAVPVIRQHARAFAKAHAEMDRGDLKRLALTLWTTEVHEARSLALAICERRVDAFRSTDLAWILALVENSNTWAHVDWLAVKVIGGMVARTPRLEHKLDEWALHKNFWVRRTALLALHDQLIAGTGNFARFARIAALMLHEREFFIRKAIGWVLRSTARKTPERTITFVKRHASEMAALTFREATRNLPVSQQRNLLRLRETSMHPKAKRRLRDRSM